jgi:hypothetical protein
VRRLPAAVRSRGHAQGHLEMAPGQPCLPALSPRTAHAAR